MRTIKTYFLPVLSKCEGINPGEYVIKIGKTTDMSKRLYTLSTAHGNNDYSELEFGNPLVLNYDVEEYAHALAKAIGRPFSYRRTKELFVLTQVEYWALISGVLSRLSRYVSGEDPEWLDYEEHLIITEIKELARENHAFFRDTLVEDFLLKLREGHISVDFIQRTTL